MPALKCLPALSLSFQLTLLISLNKGVQPRHVDLCISGPFFGGGQDDINAAVAIANEWCIARLSPGVAVLTLAWINRHMAPVRNDVRRVISSTPVAVGSGVDVPLAGNHLMLTGHGIDIGVPGR